MPMQLKDDGVRSAECLTSQHFQRYQTWRIIHLLLVYTRELQRLMHILFYSLKIQITDCRAKVCSKIREK